MIQKWILENYANSISNTINIVLYVILVALCIIIPYLLGSLNFGIIISKLFYHDDIRKYGSGNAGATNMLRTYGKKAAIFTLIFDMLKGAIAVYFGYFLLQKNGYFVDETTLYCSFEPGYLAGVCCLLGHVFPVFYKFKGGKGVATSAMVILCTSLNTNPSIPFVFFIVIGVFIVVVAGSKYVSLGSVMSAFIYPVVLNALGYPYGAKGFPVLMSIVMMMLVVFMHRENIKRIINKEESKIDFSKKGSKEDDQK